jgi:hypothetical protein
MRRGFGRMTRDSENAPALDGIILDSSRETLLKSVGAKQSGHFAVQSPNCGNTVARGFAQT